MVPEHEKVDGVVAPVRLAASRQVERLGGQLGSRRRRPPLASAARRLAGGCSGAAISFAWLCPIPTDAPRSRTGVSQTASRIFSRSESPVNSSAARIRDRTHLGPAPSSPSARSRSTTSSSTVSGSRSTSSRAAAACASSAHVSEPPRRVEDPPEDPIEAREVRDGGASSVAGPPRHHDVCLLTGGRSQDAAADSARRVRSVGEPPPSSAGLRELRGPVQHLSHPQDQRTHGGRAAPVAVEVQDRGLENLTEAVVVYGACATSARRLRPRSPTRKHRRVFPFVPISGSESSAGGQSSGAVSSAWPGQGGWRGIRTQEGSGGLEPRNGLGAVGRLVGVSGAGPPKASR
jgi:hypothetical protein